MLLLGRAVLLKDFARGILYQSNIIITNSYIYTIGIDYGVKKIPINDSLMAVNIFDLSGDDDYKSIRKTYYTDAIGVLLIYDINIKSTFDSLIKWEKEIESNGLDMSKCTVVVVGNKSDLKKKVNRKLPYRK
jgi:small GTP-binding protein